MPALQIFKTEGRVKSRLGTVFERFQQFSFDCTEFLCKVCPNKSKKTGDIAKSEPLGVSVYILTVFSANLVTNKSISDSDIKLMGWKLMLVIQL